MRQLLSELNGHERGAPYLLLNLTENVVDHGDSALRDRRSQHFLVSHAIVGTNQHPIRTVDFEKIEPRFELASAVAISGAAASTAMGRISMPLAAPLFTLLNVRMGYWASNPGGARAGGWEWLRRAVGGLPGVLLAREMASAFTRDAPKTYLSDGGHLENTGAYALLQRKASVIVVFDHGADPDWSFADLGTLIQMARIDLAVEIEIVPSRLRPDKDLRAEANFVIGSITYPGEPGTRGTLVWVKAALARTGPYDLIEYQSRHQTFPQETTADQFFEEGQFEAYRAMGAHMAASALPEIWKAIGKPTEDAC